MRKLIISALGISPETLSDQERLTIALIIIITAVVASLIFTKVIVPILRKLTERTEAEWDDLLLDPQVSDKFSRIIPAVILTAALPFIFEQGSLLDVIIERGTIVYIIYTVCGFLATFISTLFKILALHDQQKAQSFGGIKQTLQIIVWIIGIINIIAVIINKNPAILLTGLGAAATVSMLVFQDSIKGLVAGIQLSFNRMLSVGDWIALPGRNVDGVVTEITLTTVKVRNWDNTIVTVPPYSLLTESFQNWRGMQEGGGRRITRSINIDMKSVRFLSADEIATAIQNGHLPQEATARPANTVTNLEAFRYTMTQFLTNDKDINHEMSFMVRHLGTGPEGIPVQIYAFSRSKEWIPYEHVQARILENALALMPVFDLKPFQKSYAS